MGSLFNKRPSETTKDHRGGSIPIKHGGLPDSETLCGLCPRCGNQSSFYIAGEAPLTFDYDNYSIGSDNARDYPQLDKAVVLSCLHCKQCTFVVEERYQKDRFIKYRGIHWWPLPESQFSPDIPLPIWEAYSEAHRALNANCLKSAAAMARRTIEAVTVDKGESKGTLAARIKSLESKGLLHPSIVTWAVNIKDIGNCAVHDIFDPVSIDDANEVIRFTRELLKLLYEIPAEIERKRKRNP